MESVQLEIRLYLVYYQGVCSKYCFFLFNLISVFKSIKDYTSITVVHSSVMEEL